MDLFHNEFEETYGTIIDLTPPHSHSVPVPKTGPDSGFNDLRREVVFVLLILVELLFISF
jgi:hypothetical protein